MHKTGWLIISWKSSWYDWLSDWLADWLCHLLIDACIWLPSPCSKRCMITKSESHPSPIDIWVGVSGVDFLPRSAWHLKVYNKKPREAKTHTVKLFIGLKVASLFNGMPGDYLNHVYPQGTIAVSIKHSSSYLFTFSVKYQQNIAQKFEIITLGHEKYFYNISINWDHWNDQIEREGPVWGIN